MVLTQINILKTGNRAIQITRQEAVETRESVPYWPASQFGYQTVFPILHG